MAKYDYRCPECNIVVEKKHKMDAPSPTCDSLVHGEDKPVMKKIPSAGSGFILAGGGWASTGYK